MNDKYFERSHIPVHPEYLKLRDEAFEQTAEKLQIINMPDDKTCAWGAVIDMSLDGRIITLVCFFNGDVSLYYSTGGGLSGLGERFANVRNEARTLLASIGQAAFLFDEPKDRSLPNGTDNNVFLLTNKGMLYTKLNPKTITEEPRERQFIFMLYQRLMNEITRIMPHVIGAERMPVPPKSTDIPQ